jgi:hypothetical protein
MAHCRDLDEGIPKYTYPCSSEPCRGEGISANVTVDYEELGVNGTIHTYFPYVRRR